MKRCTWCKDQFPLDCFYKDASRGDGLSSRCKQCHAAQMRKYKKKNSQKILKDNKKYRNNNQQKLRQYYQENKEWILRNAKQSRTGKEGYLKTMLYSAKSRAKQRGWAFDLDLDYLIVIASDECPVDGQKFDWDRRLEQDSTLSLSIPSIDRIDSSIGYVKGNIAIIGDKWNRWKNNMTLGDLLSLTQYVRNVTKA